MRHFEWAIIEIGNKSCYFFNFFACKSLPIVVYFSICFSIVINCQISYFIMKSASNDALFVDYNTWINKISCILFVFTL